MSDDTTLPMGNGRQAGEGIGELEGSDDANMCEGGEGVAADTALDASQRLLQAAAAKSAAPHARDTRGRTRERARGRDDASSRRDLRPGVAVPESPTERDLEDEDAAIAAEALAAAMQCVPAATRGGSLESVRDIGGADLPDRNLSPEKRARTVNKAPHFGSYPQSSTALPWYHRRPQEAPAGTRT